MNRPMPPDQMDVFKPAPEIFLWLKQTIFNPDSPLYNPDHSHLHELEMPELSFMWASRGFAKAGKYVLGECEKVAFRAGGWQKRRQEMQMEDWFGEVPDFLITLDASYCNDCTDTEFLMLLEHELYHIAQKLDSFGEPSYNSSTGAPMLEIRAHDVEEFIGVVARYGANESVQKMIDAASNAPSVGKADIAKACGTCLHK